MAFRNWWWFLTSIATFISEYWFFLFFHIIHNTELKDKSVYIWDVKASAHAQIMDANCLYNGNRKLNSIRFAFDVYHQESTIFYSSSAGERNGLLISF